MRITILTLFPEMFDGILKNSIIKRALAKEIVEIKIVNIRDYTLDKYGRVDTPPIGGNPGLVMKCQPIVDAIRKNDGGNAHKLLMSPRGRTYNQEYAHQLLNLNKDIMIVCGHYEGVDERVNNYVDELISIGDFILTGGEIPAMAITDSLVRLIDGAIAKESTIEESFENKLLEYPQYTEPYDFEGHKVPDILFTGNHEAIRKYRLRESLYLTRKYRPDLFNNYQLNKEEKKLLQELDEGIEPKWLTDALAKGKKFIK